MPHSEVRQFTQTKWFASKLSLPEKWTLVIRMRSKDRQARIQLYRGVKSAQGLILTLDPWKVYLFPTLKDAKLVFTYMTDGMEEEA